MAAAAAAAWTSFGCAACHAEQQPLLLAALVHPAAVASALLLRGRVWNKSQWSLLHCTLLLQLQHEW
jgi:hypothetical protein